MATVRRKQQKTTATRKRKSKARVSPPAPPRPRRPPPQICRFDESKVGFGDLPAELRNQIYELALIPSSGAAIRIVQQPPGVAGEDIALGLLASCKAVRKEAWSFFYERNEFRVDCVYQERRCSYEMDISHGVQWRDHIVFDGYDSTKKYTPDPAKNYQQDLDKFLSATNYKLGLQSIRSISFAIYRRDHELSKSADASIMPFFEIADMVIVLKLLPKSPFFSVTINNALSKALDETKKAKILKRVRDFVGTEVDPPSGAKKMCKAIMIEFLERSYQSYVFRR